MCDYYITQNIITCIEENKQVAQVPTAKPPGVLTPEEADNINKCLTQYNKRNDTHIVLDLHPDQAGDKHEIVTDDDAGDSDSTLPDDSEEESSLNQNNQSHHSQMLLLQMLLKVFYHNTDMTSG